MKAILTIVVALGTWTLAQAASLYDANLDGLQEVPPNASPAFGQASLSLSGTTLSISTGTYQDLLGGATAVTINDAAPGVSGPILFTLTLDTPGAATGTFSGSGVLTLGQVTDLDAGNLYINIRSQVFPSGEIRGQIFAVPEPATAALGGLGILTLLALRRAR